MFDLWSWYIFNGDLERPFVVDCFHIGHGGVLDLVSMFREMMGIAGSITGRWRIVESKEDAMASAGKQRIYDC